MFFLLAHCQSIFQLLGTMVKQTMRMPEISWLDCEILEILDLV